MASNLVVARGGVEFVPPISLAFWRWTVVFIIILPFIYLSLKTNFNVSASDFDIKIPKVVRNKISQEINITAEYDLFEKL